ncbi:LuxR C-terminal-related transcriptional regulator [Actinoplanes sp. NPDC026619]|uniref:helix-turn-helix transcriptional regulator n=1 Tax=Actinoplanes sp. NPDC026619 TaxID=3155798 RepID=UPI0033E13F61
MADVAGPGREWPLAGRAGEIAAIEAGYRRPRQYGVLLTGAWGVGKSRVAYEAAARLERSGCRVAQVSARRAWRGVPFGALTHLAPGAGDGPALWSRLIAELRGPGRTVLVVDDVQFLDDASDAMLAQLVTSCPVFVIGTVGSRGGGVPEALAALWNDGRIAGLPVRPLPADEMAGLVDRLSGADAIGRHRLARLAGGNPLALRALLDVDATGEEAGAAREDGDAAREDADAAREDGDAARDGGPYERWLDEAGPAARSAVEFVACAEPVPMSLLETLVGPAAVEAAERAGLVRVDDGPAARLAPPLSGPVVRRLLPASTIRRVYGMLAPALLAGPVIGGDQVLRAGEWQVRAGTVTAPEHLLPAARLALAGHDLGLAVILAEAAREHQPGPAPDLVLAEALFRQGHGRRAAAVLPPRPPNDPEQAAAWAVTSAQIRHFGPSAPTERAGDHAEPAAALIGRGSPGEHGYGACLARLLRGDLRGAQELADRGYRDAVAAEVRSIAGIWAGLRGLTAVTQGRVQTAAAALREAVTLSTGAYCLRCEWMTELATATAIAGDSTAARRWLARADDPEHRHTAILEARIELSRAWSQAANGEPAVESCLRAAETAARSGIHAVEATALYDAARLGAPGPVHTRLADLARKVDSEVVAVMAMAARALARHDAGALGRATDAFERSGHVLLAAETATAASHARRRAGQHKPAALFQERAEALAQRCEGARTPLLDQGRLPPQLTSREREVVLLARSLTSPQIAARLGLSPRTVSNYLQNAYDKLGLAGRAELRVLLGT